MSSESVPRDLTALEYSRHIIEYETGMPALTNIKLVADCITSISKTKSLPLDKAYKYLARAISLYREQGGVVDREFFMSGDYMHVRPTAKLSGPLVNYVPMDRKALDVHQAGPEYQATIAEFRAKLAQIAGRSRME